MSQNISRRSALRKVAGASALFAASNLSFRLNAAEKSLGAGLKGRVNHSVCKWCYPKIELEDLCKAGKE
ncbi:MAG: hydroxypyruvate isomerase, partial [Verrucomicrobiota bacterium]